MDRVDCLLVKMSERMNAIRREVNGKEGIVCHVVERIREHWEKCMLYTITEGTTAENKFTVHRCRTGRDTRGKWEEIYN